VKGMVVSQNGLPDCFNIAVCMGGLYDEWIRAGSDPGWNTNETIERLINDEGWKVIE
jgi:hypothetical protein